RDQLAFGRQPANPPIGAAHLDQSFKLAPRYLLQHLVKHAILMLHGIAPRVRIVGQTSRTEWNQCHAPCPEKLNRTAVGLARSSTSCAFGALTNEDVDPPGQARGRGSFRTSAE